ncbi:hypothetical protein [Clostridium beijerinckii]|uniref:hypothetical protein n=1 Tax=Clostridium beijerinckii TaxID=1520 RepID=UPI0015CED312|nr:hypothetical protein [Clostridium beijerinckii]
MNKLVDKLKGYKIKLRLRLVNTRLVYTVDNSIKSVDNLIVKYDIQLVLYECFRINNGLDFNKYGDN